MGVPVREVIKQVDDADEFCDDAALLAKLGYKQVLFRTWCVNKARWTGLGRLGPTFRAAERRAHTWPSRAGPWPRPLRRAVAAWRGLDGAWGTARARRAPRPPPRSHARRLQPRPPRLGCRLEGDRRLNPQPPTPTPHPHPRGTITAVALTISAMSTMTSINASFATGLAYGGPVVCVWGWISERVRGVGVGGWEAGGSGGTAGWRPYLMRLGLIKEHACVGWVGGRASRQRSTGRPWGCGVQAQRRQR
jgi:hypothetical protein